MHTRYGFRLPLSPQFAHLLAKLCWKIPSLTILIAMALHAVSGPRAFPFFISESDASGFDGMVFTIGLSLAGVVQLVFAWHLYHHLEAEREKLWFLSTIFALVAAINTIALSHWDMYHHIELHIAASMQAFGCGIVWAWLAQTSLGNCASAKGRAWRNIGLTMAAFGFVLMVSSFLYATHGLDATQLSTSEYLNAAQGGIVLAAPAEYLLVAGLMVCLASFGFELKRQDSIASMQHG